MLDQFLANQSEAFFTINLVPSISYNQFNFVLLVGFFFIFVLFILFFLKKRIRFINVYFNNLFLIITFIFWLPLYIIFTYNNLHDAKENYSYIERRLKHSHKKIIRYCNLGFAMGDGDNWCKLLTFINFVKREVEEKKSVFILSRDIYLPYLVYDLYPYYNVVSSINDADYILLYNDPNYYKDGHDLVKRDNDDFKLEDYLVYDYYSDQAVIFSKK